MFESLKQWREERGLQNTVGNIEGNLAEELTELLRATTTEDKIEASSFDQECQNLIVAEYVDVQKIKIRISDNKNFFFIKITPLFNILTKVDE